MSSPSYRGSLRTMMQGKLRDLSLHSLPVLGNLSDKEPTHESDTKCNSPASRWATCAAHSDLLPPESPPLTSTSNTVLEGWSSKVKKQRSWAACTKS